MMNSNMWWIYYHYHYIHVVYISQNYEMTLLINGQIIASKPDGKNDFIKFEDLSIDLSNLSASTIKQPKIQETSTIKLLSCFKKKIDRNLEYCSDNFKKEIYPILNRRLILPFYIPIISLICSFLLIKSNKKIFNKTSIFIYCFFLLLFTELAVRYTGLNFFTRLSFLILPFTLTIIFYSFLFYRFSEEYKIKWIKFFITIFLLIS